jgi:Protein of unknown function (DUF3383)
MGLGDIVQVSVSLVSGGLSLAGFGTPLILGGYSKVYPERVRFYTDLTGLSVDFAAGTPEYLAAQAVFAQNPRPSKLAVGRCALKPTQKWTITPVTTIQAIQTYTVKIAGVAYSFVSDATPTAAEVVTGLTTVINAATGTHSLVASGSNTLVLTHNTAGGWQYLEVGDVNLLRVEQNHADPGIATDLAAIALESADWYCILNPWNATAEVAAIAAWAEANQKLYVAQTQETQVVDTADGSATDIAHVLKASSYSYTGLVYSPSNGDFLDAAMAGACLPLDPGSETWANKTLAGVAVRTFTATHVTNLQAKRCGWYYMLAGRAVTREGKVASSTIGFIDLRRAIDALVQDMQARSFLAVATSKKIAYTDAGMTVLQGAILAALEAAEKGGTLVPGSWSCTIPKVAAQSSTDRANRYVPGIAWAAQAQGAAHTLSIQGTLTV